ncbi:dTDP-4-amino-4,6-dideoxygalactose transaminase [Selenomonas ruminantium]|nr:dTDP-4-amino-4,6-dideoxygalactose transaminase [Selenomonas ruminantium]
MAEKMINFNEPPIISSGNKYVVDAIACGKLSGDGKYTKKCSRWLEENFNCNKVLLTTSCSMALDMAAILCDVKPGDDVILPSFTFSSTANSFALRGANLVFIDIDPKTMNMDADLLEKAINNNTKVIIPVHYAGISCDMDAIMSIAKKHDIFVVEDAAQGVMSTYKDKALGTMGDLGCYSFHETKNFSMGEGGALLINNEKLIKRAEIIREKGTNRAQFLRGEIDKYTWVDLGDSFLPSDLNAAYLWGQLEVADDITKKRMHIWEKYYNAFKEYEKENRVELPNVPSNCKHNAHLFYIKFKDIEERTEYIKFMKGNGIACTFHYVPLHSAPAGLKYGGFSGEDNFTTRESKRLVRLPLHYNLEDEDIEYVISCTKKFVEMIE